MLMGGVVMAQGHRKGDRREVTPKERAERMTERMAKEYSLNDTQKKELLATNTALMEKMGNRHAVKQDRKGKTCQASDSCTCRKGKGDAPKMAKEDREKLRQEMKASREAYEAQLKKILTKDQYATYAKKQADRQQKMNERRQRK